MLKNKIVIALFGKTGFIGSNFFNNFSDKYQFETIDLRRDFNFDEISKKNIDVFLNFVGKAHDLKKISNPDEYYKINTDLSTKIYKCFLNSNAKKFITLSSVKAVADYFDGDLDEFVIPNPKTHYGISKHRAEQFILSNPPNYNKSFFILRLCMVHGPNNKGNLNLLYNFINKGFPWPLGSYKNKRSFCSINNLFFILNELIERNNLNSGIYNIADTDTLSTNSVIKIINSITKKNTKILKIPKFFIRFICKIGDAFNLPFNTENLNKLTENFVVSNNKIITELGKSLPYSTEQGLEFTFSSFNNQTAN